MLFIILPAYNEEKALPLLLKDIQRVCYGLDYQVIVVNDGSTDQTDAKVLAFNNSVTLLTHERNLGLGAALLTGFKHALRQVDDASGQKPAEGKRSTLKWLDTIVTLDADNTHPAELIPLLYAQIQVGKDIAVASRYTEGGKQLGLRPWRRLLSWGAGKLMQRFFPLPGIKDYSCGYRAYNLSRIREGLDQYGDALMESKNFAAMVELLIKLAPLCRHFGEVPLELHYERKAGPSKMKTLSTIAGYFSLILRIKLLKNQVGGWNEEQSKEWPDEWPEEWARE